MNSSKDLTHRLLNDLFSGDPSLLLDSSDNDTLFVGPVKCSWAVGIEQLKMFLSVNSSSILLVNKIECTEVASHDSMSVIFASAYVTLKNHEQIYLAEIGATVVWKYRDDFSPVISHIHISANTSSPNSSSHLSSSVFNEQMISALYDSKNDNQYSSDLTFKSINGHIYRVCPADITYVTSSRQFCTVHTINDESFVLRRSLLSVTKYLGSDFCRIHRSYTVNLHYVAENIYDKIILKSGLTLPLSRQHRNEFKVRLKEIRYE